MKDLLVCLFNLFFSLFGPDGTVVFHRKLMQPSVCFRSQCTFCRHTTGGISRREEEEKATSEENKGHYASTGHDVKDGRYCSTNTHVTTNIPGKFTLSSLSDALVCFHFSGQSVPEEEEEEEVEEEYTDDSDGSDMEDRPPPAENQPQLMANQRLPPPAGPVGQQGPPHLQGPPMTGPPPLGPPPAPPLRPPGPPSGPPPGPPPG